MRIRTKILKDWREGADKVLALSRRNHSPGEADSERELFKRPPVTGFESHSRMNYFVTCNPGHSHRLRQGRVDKDFPRTVLRSDRRPAFSNRLAFKSAPASYRWKSAADTDIPGDRCTVFRKDRPHLGDQGLQPRFTMFKRVLHFSFHFVGAPHRPNSLTLAAGYRRLSALMGRLSPQIAQRDKSRVREVQPKQP